MAYMKEATKADVADLVNWLATKDTNGTYDPDSSYNCMICQYLKDRGVEFPSFTGSMTVRVKDNYYVVPLSIRKIAYGTKSGNINWGIQLTYGEAHRRALKELQNFKG